MNGLKIGLMERAFRGVFESVIDPNGLAIESAIRCLTSRSGRVDLYEDKDGGKVIMVCGSPGTYSLDVIIGDSNAAMLVAKSKGDESGVEVFGEEYRADQVVHDVDLVVGLVNELIASNRFVDTGDTKWEFRQI